MNFRFIPGALALALLGVGSARAQAVWNGGGGANTDWSDSSNWSSAPLNSFTQTVQFSSGTSFTSTLDSNFDLASLTVFNGAGALVLNNVSTETLSISGAFTDGSANSVSVNIPLIYGTMSIQMSGTGTLTLNGTSNTYGGTTNITSGTLQDGNAGAFSPNSGVVVASGATLGVNHNETISYLDNYMGNAGSVVIASGATLIMNGGYTTTFPGVISGGGNLEKDVTGTLTLTGANTYTGTTVINGAGGTGIQIGSGGTTGSIASSGVSGTGTLGFDLSSPYSYAGTLSGALQVVQSGSGTTTLSGTNTYTGGTTVNSGTLQAGSTSAFGTLSAVTVNGSATLDLNNFSNTVGTLNGLTTTSYITLGTGTLTIGTAAANSTYDGTISGGGGLTLNNVDGYTLTLAGNNTYTGATAVTNGTLLALNTAGSAVGTGPITIGSGAVLQVGSMSTTGAIGTASIADNGTLTFARTDSISIPNVISGFGGVTVDRGTVTLTGNNTYTGVTSIFNSTVDAGSATALGNHSTVDLSTNGILNLTTFNVTVGNISSPVDTSTTVNLGANTLTLGNAVSNQTFAGAITGTGALDVISTIDMTSNLNTYSGGTTIAGGTFIADNTSGSATGTGAVTISGGGTLIIGNDSTTGFITNLPITDNGLVDFQRTNAVTFPNAITGTGSVEAQDGGTITLTGTNTYSGFTNVTGGLTGTSLVAGSTNAFGNGTSAVSLAPGASTGTLNLNGFNNAIGSVVGNTNTFIVLGSATLTDGAAGGTNIYGGVISGTGGLNVVSPGNVVLTGANTYGGPTSIASGGRLELGFGGTTGSIANSSGVSGAGTLQYDLTNATTYAGAISGAISVTQSGTGTTILTGANTYTGLTSVNSGTLSDSGATSFSPASQMLVNTSGTLLVNSNEVVANLQNGASGGHVAIASGATLTSNGANYVSDFNGVISGAGSFVINGGTQGLSGANTLSGGVTLESGELYIGGNSAFGSGTLTLDAGTNIAPEANATLSNPVVLSGSGYVINNWGPSNLTLTGTVSGTGEFSWCTTNTLTLTGSNTFTSGIDMREGTLLLGNDQAAGIGGTIILDLGTYLDAAGSGVTRNIANPIYVSNTATQIGEGNDNILTLSGVISGTGTASVVTIDNGLSGSVTLSGTNTISNTTFDVNNGGTVFAATGSAFGATTNPVVLQGGSTLNVLGSITIANPITAGTGANTLAGNGTITNNSSALAITNSVILSPSASPGGGPGNLTFTAPLIFTGGAIHFQLYNATGAPGTGWGEITASGGMNFAAATANSITFNVVSVNSTGGSAAALNFNPGSSYVWTFATSPSITSFNAADFNIITSGFTNGTGGGGFSVSQVGNNLNLDFTPVPEPSTWALMAAGILALATFEIRRRRPARA